MLDMFDAGVAAARKALATVSNEDLMKEWSLLSGGKALVTMPRYGVIRNFVINHAIHHRGHMCVYLRLNDVPVPGLYGPSADEEG